MHQKDDCTGRCVTPVSGDCVYLWPRKRQSVSKFILTVGLTFFWADWQITIGRTDL